MRSSRLYRWSLAVVVPAAVAMTVGSIQVEPAHAQDKQPDELSAKPTGNKKKARRLLAAGDRSLARGDKLLTRGKKAKAQESFLDALKQYKAAYDEVNDPRIFNPMGLAQKRLGRHLASLRLFTKFLDESSKVNEALRTDTTQHIEELKENLGAIFFRVDPAGAEVFVNDESIGRSPLSQPHYVTPGQYDYRVAKDGFQSESGTVDVEAGDSRGDEIILTRKIKPAAPDIGEDEDREDEQEAPIAVQRQRPKARSSALPLQIGIGLTGALAIGATVTGLIANSRHNTFTDEAASAQARESARSSGKSLALATDVMIIGGLAAATYSTYYYFVGFRGNSRAPLNESESEGEGEALAASEHSKDHSSIVVSPIAGRDFGGMVVHGRF